MIPRPARAIVYLLQVLLLPLAAVAAPPVKDYGVTNVSLLEASAVTGHDPWGRGQFVYTAGAQFGLADLASPLRSYADVMGPLYQGAAPQ